MLKIYKFRIKKQLDYYPKAMNIQPTLEDDLILIRPLRQKDYESLYEVSNDPLLWEQHPAFDRYKRNVFTELFEDAMASKGALIVIDKATNTVIGSSRYKLVENVATAVEIGWTFLSRKYWGGKYNRAMKKLMIDHALQNVEDVILYIGKENIRSWKAAEKIGANKIVEPEYQIFAKKDKDDWIYRINRKDWEMKNN
jgi:RimJ/RimL family protein N-acetyltransferase